MEVLANVILGFTILVCVYAILATCVGVLSILKRRDEFYKSKYEDFLAQKKRVQDRLRRDNGN